MSVFIARQSILDLIGDYKVMECSIASLIHEFDHIVIPRYCEKGNDARNLRPELSLMFGSAQIANENSVAQASMSSLSLFAIHTVVVKRISLNHHP